MKIQAESDGKTTDVDDERTFLPGRLIFRTQAPPDGVNLEKLCPRDQDRYFVARWIDRNNLTIEEMPRPSVTASPKPAADGEVTGLGTGEGGGEDDPAAAAAKAEADAAELKRLTELKDPDLKALAGERGVKWDNKASRETMVDRIFNRAASAEKK